MKFTGVGLLGHQSQKDLEAIRCLFLIQGQVVAEQQGQQKWVVAKLGYPFY
jgi:hypothetical protein